MIDRFMGEYRWLSNFGESQIRYDGLVFQNAEAAYQAAKTENLEDRIAMQSMTGKEAKKAGYALDLRADWDAAKVLVMSEVIHAKFAQSATLQGMLIATYPETLIEGNTWGDTFWGVCKGEGKNWLGRILMAERAYWRNIQRTAEVEFWLPNEL